MVAFQNPIVYYLVVPSGASSGQRIVINGVTGDIELYNSNNDEVGIISPTAQKWINSTNTGMIWVQPNGGVGTGGWPEIDFFTATTSGGYVNAAFINASADANGNPTIGINNGPENVSGISARARIFLSGQGSSKSIGLINTGTEAPMGGNLWFDGSRISLIYFDPATNVDENELQVAATATTSTLPVQTGSWVGVSYQNGWGDLGSPYSPVQYRLCSDGYVHLRGVTHNAASAADGTVIFSVPQGFEPPASKFITVTGDSGNVALRIVVTAGNPTNVAIYGLNGTTDVGLDAVMWESATYMA